MLHEGPWFCGRCKGHIAHWGYQDMLEDFGLIDHLFVGFRAGSPQEDERIRKAAQIYQALGKEL